MSDPTYSMTELATLAGISTRTLREWTARSLVPAPALHGRATRYTHDQLLRVAAIAALRRQGLSFEEVCSRIVVATPAELESFVAPSAAPPPVPDPPPPVPPPTYPAQTWHRVTLLPGLELHVDLARGPALQRLAQAIHEHYGAAATPAP